MPRSNSKGSEGKTIYLVLLPMFVGSELMEICVRMLGMLAFTLRPMQYHKYNSIRVYFGSTSDIGFQSCAMKGGEQAGLSCSCLQGWDVEAGMELYIMIVKFKDLNTKVREMNSCRSWLLYLPVRC
jgi:hypothetical protein